MIDFFKRNKGKVATVLSGSGSLANKITLVVNLLVGFIFSGLLSDRLESEIVLATSFISISIVSIVLFVMILILEKKVWRDEFIKSYEIVFNKAHENIEQYIKVKFDDNALIADPVFTIDSGISKAQFNKQHKNIDNKINYRNFKSYLSSNSDKWFINDVVNNINIISPFRVTAICFFEHSVIFVSQMTSLPNCDMSSLNAIEEKYLHLDCLISNGKVVIGEFNSEPVNQDVILKLTAIINVLKPCMV